MKKTRVFISLIALVCFVGFFMLSTNAANSRSHNKTAYTRNSVVIEESTEPIQTQIQVVEENSSLPQTQNYQPVPENNNQNYYNHACDGSGNCIYHNDCQFNCSNSNHHHNGNHGHHNNNCKHGNCSNR